MHPLLHLRALHAELVVMCKGKPRKSAAQVEAEMTAMGRVRKKVADKRGRMVTRWVLENETREPEVTKTAAAPQDDDAAWAQARIEDTNQFHHGSTFVRDPALEGTVGIRNLQRLPVKLLREAANALRPRVKDNTWKHSPTGGLGTLIEDGWPPPREQFPSLTRAEVAILDAVTLFTGANVASVRDPSKFNARQVDSSRRGPGRWFLPQKEITRAAYRKANIVLGKLAQDEDPEREPVELLRGMRLPQTAVDALEPGGQFDLGDLSSWTTAWRTATLFAFGASDNERRDTRKAPVMLHMTTRRGFELGALSAFPTEREVLIGGRVTVTSKRLEQGTWHIDVTVDAPPLAKGVRAEDLSWVQALLDAEFDRRMVKPKKRRRRKV